ncbi:MAG: relaxase/mobilization nuclease domain-containing protein [Rikenellaceae bacterium]
MMAKITKGTSFNGLVKYVMDDKKSANMIDSNGVRIRDLAAIAQSFDMQSEMNRRVTKPVGHISLDFSQQDWKKLNDVLMAKIAREYMMKMGILDTQYIIGRHHDKMHPHCHIIFNRVNNYGRSISDSNDQYRSEKICKELTRKHGLYFADGKEKVKRQRLRGKDQTKYKIYDSLVKNVPLSKSWAELEDRLRRDGIEIGYKTKGSTSQIEGVRFTADNTTFNGSKVDRQYSYSKIDFALRQNQREEQRESQQSFAPQWNIEQSKPQEQNENLLGGALGLLDFTDNPAIDTEEEAFRRSMQKKKKPQRKMKF